MVAGVVFPILVIALSTLGWPVLELSVFWLRFRHLPPNGPAEALVFLPMGLVAGVVCAALMIRSSTTRQRRFVGLGYLAASPFALVGALLGGLALPGFWGPLVAGAGPLCLGCAIGFAVGRSHGGTA